MWLTAGYNVDYKLRAKKAIRICISTARGRLITVINIVHRNAL